MRLVRNSVPLLWLLVSSEARLLSPKTGETEEQDLPNQLQRVDLPADLVAKHQAYCLDGSPYKYYIRPPASSNNKNYVLYFQGGGWCYTAEDCVKRSKSNLGSSTNWPETIVRGPALLNARPERNPLFYPYHHIYLPYCDGASFAGNRDGPLNVTNVSRDDSLLWFRGWHNLQAVLEHLGMLGNDHSVENMLITGCSAGGLATYLHSDTIRQMLPATAKVKALPESGIFLFHTNVRGEPVYETEMHNVFVMQNATVHPQCIDHLPGKYHYQCLSAITTLKYMETPMFIFNSVYDSWNLRCNWMAEMGPEPHACNKVPNDKWRACISDLNQCTAPQRRELWKWGDTVLDGVVNSGALFRPGNGAFLHSCYSHCLIDGAKVTLGQLSIRGVSLEQAIADWWLDESAEPQTNVHWPCRLNAVGPPACNPTCPATEDNIDESVPALQ